MSIDKSYSEEGNRAVARFAGIIGIATFCSRILGFGRDIVIARLFGVYVYAQAFVIAFKIPNLFRDFVGEGATNAAFVPVFSEYALKRKKEEFWELANVVLNILLITLMGITILGELFAPVIVRIIAPGFIAFPEKLAATITLTRIIFPYIILISLVAYCMGILNSLRHFTVPAFAPCLLNISIIVFALVWSEGIKGLAAGVLVGGVLQLAVQLPVLYKKGFRLNLFRRFRHPAAESILRMMVPRVASTSIYQLNNFIDSIFASLATIVGEGAVAVLYFAYRLILFPIGIFSNSLAQALLPVFSRQALGENKEDLKKSLSFGLRTTFFVMIPASAGFMALSGPIISTLFGGGKFDANSVVLTSGALFFYSIGLCAYAVKKIVSSCFFALKDTLTPAKVSFLNLILNIIFNIIFMFPFRVNGLALATSVSGIITAFILFSLLKKKLHGFDVTPVLVSFVKISIASIAMAFVCLLSTRVNISLGNAGLNKIFNLLLPISAGMISYTGLCFILRVEEIHGLLRWLLANKKP